MLRNSVIPLANCGTAPGQTWERYSEVQDKTLCYKFVTVHCANPLMIASQILCSLPVLFRTSVYWPDGDFRGGMAAVSNRFSAPSRGRGRERERVSEREGEREGVRERDSDLAVLLGIRITK